MIFAMLNSNVVIKGTNAQTGRCSIGSSRMGSSRFVECNLCSTPRLLTLLIAAWITGWSNWLGQITGSPSVNYGTSAMILAAASIRNPSYVPTDYQTFLLTVLLMVSMPNDV